MYCGWCGSNKHTRDTCSKLGGVRKYCWNCGKYGHSSKNCPGKWGNIGARELERKRGKGEFDGVDLE